MKNKHFTWRFINIVVICLMVFLMPVNAAFGEESRKTVKVGCVDIDNFLEIREDNSVWGYAAEYLDKIASYSGWEYEYIPGSWAECLEWLKEGRIDLLLPAVYSDERSQDYLYSDEVCGLDYVALIGRKEDESLYYEDYEAFDGLKVGMIRGNYANQVFEQYSNRYSFTVEQVYFDSWETMNDALRAEAVDAVVSGNMNFQDDQKLLAKVESLPSYFITSVKRQDLMDELNQILRQVQLEDPYYVSGLHKKYYGNLERQAVGYTRKEVEYIGSAGELTVLCKTDCYPLEWYDEKSDEFRGIYPDILRRISKNSGLSFRMEPAYSDSWERISGGNADLMMSVSGSKELAAEYHMWMTNPYYNTRYLIVGKRGRPIDLNGPVKVAIHQNHLGIQTEAVRSHPNWKITAYQGEEACLDAVQNGEVDAAFLDLVILQNMPYLSERSDLSIAIGFSLAIPVSFGVSQQRDEILRDILNKAILRMSEEEINQCVLKNTLYVPRRTTLVSIIRDHPIYAGVIALIFGVLAVLLVGSIYINRLKTRQNQVLELKNKQLEEAARLEAELRKKSQTDILTGLHNKASVENLCRSYIETNRTPGALVILDMDNFKQVNDNYGHKCGDQLLKRSGMMLQSLCRGKDVVGRIGGDEFLIFMPGLTSREVLGERLNMILDSAERIWPDDNKIELTWSAGAAFTVNSRRFEDVFNLADQALYQAKNSGRNCYRISE